MKWTAERTNACLHKTDGERATQRRVFFKVQKTSVRSPPETWSEDAAVPVASPILLRKRRRAQGNASPSDECQKRQRHLAEVGRAAAVSSLAVSLTLSPKIKLKDSQTQLAECSNYVGLQEYPSKIHMRNSPSPKTREKATDCLGTADLRVFVLGLRGRAKALVVKERFFREASGEDGGGRVFSAVDDGSSAFFGSRGS